jgi:hypothetical protein
MKKLLEYTTAEGDKFFIEIMDASVNESVRSGFNETRGLIQNATESFEKSLKPLKNITSSIFSSIKEIVNSPDEITVELGLKFSAQAGIILTSLDSEANLKIGLKWKKSETKNS